MLNERAFQQAVRAFNKMRGNSLQCLRVAISVFKAEETHEVISTYKDLTFSTADTPKGADTALVISGFENIGQLETFLADVVHAPRK